MTRISGLRRVLPAALVVVALAVPATAAPKPSPTQEPEDPVRVVITDILPRAPQRGSAVEIKGTLRNTGTRPVTNLRVRLQVGEIVTRRGELHDADEDRPPTSPRVGVSIPGTLGAGRSVPFDVRTDAGSLGLTGMGVYPLDVVARGNAGDGIDSLGLAPTWLPFFADVNPRPTRVAVVWPLVDEPHLRPDGSLADDRLAALLAQGGRLGRLLDAARGASVPECEQAAVRSDGVADPRPTRCLPVPVTYAVDPDLLDAVHTMLSPYRVRRSGKTTEGKGTAAATAWLSALESTDLRGRVLALPYADPDVSALARDVRGRDDVSNAVALGNQVVQQVLDVPPISSVAWPPPGPVTPAAANTLSLAGARTFVLDPTAFDQDATPPNHTPTAQAPFTTSSTGADLEGLVVDTDLSALLTGRSQDGSRVAEQRFIAETAIVAAERPGQTRTLVLALPRGGDVERSGARSVLRDLGRLPWLCPVDLTAVASGTATCTGLTEGRVPTAAGRGQARTDDEGELSQSFLRRVATDRETAIQLTDAVLSPDPAVQDQVAALKGRLRRAVARAESSSGRTDPANASRCAQLLHDTVRSLAGAVVVRGGHALLTSSKGTLSVSLENTLEVPVQVRVRFTSKTATLTNAETGLVTVQAGHAVQASVRAEARRSGQFVVFAQVVDRNGRTFGPESELIVRSTRFGRLALALTLAAAAVLLLAAGVRIFRRALRSGAKTDGTPQ
jgi:hypothetical protein